MDSTGTSGFGAVVKGWKVTPGSGFSVEKEESMAFRRDPRLLKGVLGSLAGNRVQIPLGFKARTGGKERPWHSSCGR